MTTMNPYVYGATQALGIGMGAYGAYQQSQEAQKQYELAVKAWQDEQDRQARLDEQNKNQQMLQNIMGYGNYAQGISDKAQNEYTDYARMIGR